MEYQVLLFLKNNRKFFINVVCCSCDWRFKDYYAFTAMCNCTSLPSFRRGIQQNLNGSNTFGTTKNMFKTGVVRANEC